MFNDYQINGDVTTIFLNYKKERLKTIVSTRDLYKLKKSNALWNIVVSRKGYSPYVKARINGKMVSLHRFLTEAQKGKCVDHINRDTLDNRQENLRVVTNSENRQNTGLQKNNKSGYRGVYWYKREKKWRAGIELNGKYVQLGLFEDVHEAGRVAHEARKELMKCYTGDCETYE